MCCDYMDSNLSRIPVTVGTLETVTRQAFDLKAATVTQSLCLGVSGMPPLYHMLLA